MKRSGKQAEFEGKGLKKPPATFGGKQKAKGNPKGKRPLASKLPLHVVLRAKQGGMRLPRAFTKVDSIVFKTARKHGVAVYKYANVGNHLHIVMKVSRIQRWPAFIRELTGRIAKLVKTLQIAPKGENFWLYRPFTRIVSGWKKAFRDVKAYVVLNQLEAEGHIDRRETKSLKELRAIWDGG